MATKVRIYSVFDWGAQPPRGGREILELVPMSKRWIEHHTAGHAAEIENPLDQSLEEAFRYARDIQAFHMRPKSQRGRGWLDSGHNFLVCRGGWILQGRHLTISAIRAGLMVRSAHTLGDDGRPSQNDQIGIEFEHAGTEPMTNKQREAGAKLLYWIATQYRKSAALPGYPHNKYSQTTCPANLIPEIKAMRARANELLTGV
jgi:hypothetical protein